MEKIFYGVADIARELNISVSHLYHLMGLGVLSIPRRPRGQYYADEKKINREKRAIEVYNLESKRRGH